MKICHTFLLSVQRFRYFPKTLIFRGILSRDSKAFERQFVLFSQTCKYFLLCSALIVKLMHQKYQNFRRLSNTILKCFSYSHTIITKIGARYMKLGSSSISLEPQNCPTLKIIIISSFFQFFIKYSIKYDYLAHFLQFNWTWKLLTVYLFTQTRAIFTSDSQKGMWN